MTNPLKGVTFPGLPGEFQIPQNAEDVGARPDTWMPTAEDVGALSAAFSGTVSGAWESNKTYYVGYYCIYLNVLWRCKVQCTGVTPTEGTYWTAIRTLTEIYYTKANKTSQSSSPTFEQGTTYTFPHDGYITAYSAEQTTGTIQVRINDAGGSKTIAFIYMNITGRYQMQSLFVRAGMEAYVQSLVAGGSVFYYPLDTQA